MTILRRLPLRVRLTLAFAGVMALVLAAVGLFLVLRLSAELTSSIDQGLRQRAGDLSALVKQADSGLAEAGRSPLTRRGESIAQVLSPAGGVLDAPPPLRSRSLLRAGDLARARTGSLTLDRDQPGGLDEEVRLLAAPVRAQGRRLVIVVGTSLEERRSALSNLVTLLLLGGPAALLLASLAGYGVAAGALRPVEAMRARAARVSAESPGQRLPVPASSDEIARLGDTLNAMLARLELALSRERELLADASHEIRTPLAILKAELELAAAPERTLAELRDAVLSAREETDRLAQLAEDLLVIARSDQGRLPVRADDVGLAELLEHVGQRFGRRATAHGMSITMDPGEVRVVHADPLRLEQALGNLLDNALRHGDGPRVTLRAVSTDGRVELHVLDSGPGFPAGFVEHAFDRFSRGDPARGRGGTGLGLAIVAAIARSHAGGVGARNSPEGGADVWIWLPVRPVPDG